MATTLKDNTLIDAGPVRRHLKRLAGVNIGLRTVAELTAVDRASLYRIRSGQTARVRTATAAAVLAVSDTHVAAGATVEAADTNERVAELLADGWTRAEIARKIGAGDRLRIGDRYVLAATASAVEELWALHFNTPTAAPQPQPVKVNRSRRPDYEDLFDAIADIFAARRSAV